MRRSTRILPALSAILTLLGSIAARNVPAVPISWANPVSGDWSVAGNWNPAQVPTSADDVSIVVAGTYTVTCPGGNARSVTVGGASGVQTLAVTSTLTLTSASTIGSHALLDLSSTMNFNGATLTVAGTFHWTTGSIGGVAVTMQTGSSLQLAGAANKAIGGSISNSGTTTWSGAGGFNITGGSVFSNEAGGIFDSQSDADIFCNGGCNIATAFVNAGTFRKSGGAGMTSVFVTSFTNTGTVDAQSGILNFPNGSLASSGASNVFQASSSAEIDLHGNNTFTGTSFAGVGLKRILDGAQSFAGSVSISNLRLEGSGAITGTATLLGTLNWLGGSMSGTFTFPAASSLVLSGAATKGMAGSIDHFGNTTWSGTGGFNITGGAVFTNHAGAVFDAQATDIFCNGGCNTPTAFVNDGTFRRSANPGLLTVAVTTFTNTGTIDVQTGTVTFPNGSLSSSGAPNLFQAASGAEIDFHGNNSFTGTSFAGVGLKRILDGTQTFAGSVSLSNVQLEGSGSIIGTATLLGTLNWLGGSLNGTLTIAAPSSLLLTGASTKAMGGSIDNFGTTTWSGAGGFNISGGAVFTNHAGALFEAQATDIFCNGGCNTPTAFVNDGTFRRSGGAGLLSVAVSTFTNTGTVDAAAGTIHFGLNQFTQTGGATHLSGGALAADGNMAFQGGVLDGTGTITANVVATNTAQINPGTSPGRIAIVGNLTVSPPATVNIELNGLAPQTQYDQITVSGTANLGGTLTATLGFTPVAGDTFSIVTYASHFGTFGTVNLPPAPGTLNWLTQYAANAVILRLQGLLPAAPFRVDTHAGSGTTSDVNRVFDPGETVLIEPSWLNATTTPATFSGIASNFVGPVGAAYTITGPTTNYGTVPAGATVNAFDAGGTGYSLTVSNPATRPTAHWDTTVDEALSSGEVATWTLHIGDSFTDVPKTAFYRFIETIFHNAITAGCGPAQYCPAGTVTRAQMAVFLLKSKNGSSYVPPPATGTVFADVPINGFAAAFIEKLAADGVSGGCGGGNFCPNSPATRAQMSVFLLRTLEGPAYLPPACVTPTFGDVPCSSGFARWIEELHARSITAGCTGGNFCPNDPNTRREMAVFLSLTFGLNLYGP